MGNVEKLYKRITCLEEDNIQLRTDFFEILKDKGDEIRRLHAEVERLTSAWSAQYDEIKQLQKENEEMIERFNAQAICAEEFAKTMAENAMIKKANAELRAEALYWKVKCHGKGL